MSPRSSQQFEEVRAKSKQNILDAALKLFAQRGYHNTTIAQIAEEAGVAKGLVNYYFKKKETVMKKKNQKIQKTRNKL